MAHTPQIIAAIISDRRQSPVPAEPITLSPREAELLTERLQAAAQSIAETAAPDPQRSEAEIP